MKSTKRELMRTIISSFDSYRSDAVASVIRNRHMNDLSGDEKISQELVDTILTGFISYTEDHCPENVDVKTVGRMLDTLVINIRGYRNAGSVAIDAFTSSCEEISQKIKVIDAILSGFANHIAAKYCVDLALYTKDLVLVRAKVK